MSFLSKENAPRFPTDGNLAVNAKRQIDSISDSSQRDLLNQTTGTILLNMADNKWNQDQREAGLEILKLISKRNRIPYFLSAQLGQYITILKQLNDEFHPYEAVENLFDAGVILFADMPLAEESRQSIIAEMEKITGYFSSDIPTHDGLRETIGKFSERKESDNAIPARTSPKKAASPRYALLPESQIQTIVPFSRRRTKSRKAA